MALAGLDAAFLLIVSVMPVPETPAKIPSLDKLAHLCEYWLFAWLLTRVLRSARHPLRNAWLIAVGYGAAIELVQALIPWRSCELADVVANALGAALGIWGQFRMTNVEFRIRHSPFENRHS